MSTSNRLLCAWTCCMSRWTEAVVPLLRSTSCRALFNNVLLKRGRERERERERKREREKKKKGSSSLHQTHLSNRVPPFSARRRHHIARIFRVSKPQERALGGHGLRDERQRRSAGKNMQCPSSVAAFNESVLAAAGYFDKSLFDQERPQFIDSGAARASKRRSGAVGEDGEAIVDGHDRPLAAPEENDGVPVVCNQSNR